MKKFLSFFVIGMSLFLMPAMSQAQYQTQTRSRQGIYLCKKKMITANKLGLKQEMFEKINKIFQLLKYVVFGICGVWLLMELFKSMFAEKDDAKKHKKQIKNVIFVFLMAFFISMGFNLIATGKMLSSSEKTYSDLRRRG
ncbi:MAG: hypothetical protein ACTSXV_00530, partial [Alphaproteobacteria bacterium]